MEDLDLSTVELIGLTEYTGGTIGVTSDGGYGTIGLPFVLASGETVEVEVDLSEPTDYFAAYSLVGLTVEDYAASSYYTISDPADYTGTSPTTLTFTFGPEVGTYETAIANGEVYIALDLHRATGTDPRITAIRHTSDGGGPEPVPNTGGATWDDAGTLVEGSGNTHNVADATVDDIFDSQIWWTFTVAPSAVVDLAVGPGTNFALFRGTVEADLEFVDAVTADGSEEDGVTANYLLTPDTYYLVVGAFGTPPVAYQVTYTRRTAATSSWISDLRDDPDNIVTIVDVDSDWQDDVIRPGSFRKGDIVYQETLGGPWSSLAEDCAIQHALWGDQFSASWTNVCPTPASGTAVLELLGNSSVSHEFSSHTGLPFSADSARVEVNTVSWGIWLKPVEENLPPYGVLPAPDPVDYGFPAEARIEYEADVVELIGLEIADRAGSLGDDPDSRYAVNYDKQPSFGSGTWAAWPLGTLPGVPAAPPAWNDGPEDYSLTFASEGVAEGDKTRHALDVPVDGFASLTEDYLNDTYDYGIVAGPAEAFGERTLNADRIAAVGLTLYVHVRSPRFRFIYDGPTTVVRQWPRDDVRGTSSAPRLWPPTKSRRGAGGYPGGFGA